MAEFHPLRSNDQNPTTKAYAQLNKDAERRAKECRSAQMPSLTHLGLRDYDTVYEPSDDTYLLIDAIGMDIDIMEGKSDGDVGTVEQSNIRRTLEIGCGTGVPTVYLAGRCSTSETNMSPVHFVTDINPDAIRIAKSTAERNGIPANTFKAFQCDLASDILEELENKVDILIFNPPYVPTPDEEVGSNGIEASWAGGRDGRVVLDRALSQIARLLAFPHGVAFIVVVDDNYPEQISQIMEETYGIKVFPWMRRRARNEFLTILKMKPTREFRCAERT